MLWKLSPRKLPFPRTWNNIEIVEHELFKKSNRKSNTLFNVTEAEIEPGCGNGACCINLAFLMSLKRKLSLDVEIEPAVLI